MKKTERQRLRENRKRRVKLKIQKDPGKLRLSIFKSSKHIYGQIIDDRQGRTLVSVSSLSPVFREKMKTGGNIQAAVLVGSLLGEKALQQGIQKIYFDRNGFIYAGRVKALADAVREKGVKI